MAPGQTPPPDPADAGWTNRLGQSCLRALGVVALASVPTALRTSGAGGPFLEGLLVGMGVLLPLVLLALVLSRAAGRGFRQLVGAASPRAAVLGLALWIGIATPLLAALGALLKSTTHHRGLGGATFGVLALAIAVGSALLAQRLVNLGRVVVARGIKPWIPAAVGTAVGVLPLLVVATALGNRGDDANAAAVRAAIVDGAIVVVATALAASIELGATLGRAARLAGVPAAVVLFVAAGARIESSPALARAMRAGGGLASTILGALERWTDRDNDGTGAHFGGDDCDEGDPSRHPGAPEIPGDGIDQDCDGIDPRRAAPLVTAQTKPGSGGPTLPASVVDKPAGPRPDIVLITLDTVRADHTTPYGYGKETTPHLAELAARGVVFEHAYTPGADAVRALMPLVSGKRYGDTPHGRGDWPTILPENDTVAERLKKGGYRTAAVTSFTWLSDERGFAQGFDYFKPVFVGLHPEHEVTGHLATRAALAVWRSLEADSHPIFLWIHLFDAHERYVDHPGIHLGKGREGAYDGEVAFVDKQIGEIVAGIGAGPRASQVAWIVHGSNGEGLNEHNYTGHGGELHDEVLRVPLVIALPDGKPGRYGKDAVSTVDLAPTVTDLGRVAGDGFTGTSLAPIARGDFAQTHGPVYARSRSRAALIDWPLKLMVVERKKSDRYFLYDLGADPGEKADLSKSRTEDVERLIKEKGAFEVGAR
jgi:hypothetical protein